MCTPHVPRIAGKPQEAACRWLFDREVILLDKITLHDAPYCMMDPASRWPEVATVVRMVVIIKFLLNFVACYGTSNNFSSFAHSFFVQQDLQTFIY
jgi:hypothetical protein